MVQCSWYIKKELQKTVANSTRYRRVKRYHEHHNRMIVVGTVQVEEMKEGRSAPKTTLQQASIFAIFQLSVFEF